MDNVLDYRVKESLRYGSTRFDIETYEEGRGWKSLYISFESLKDASEYIKRLRDSVKYHYIPHSE